MEDRNKNEFTNTDQTDTPMRLPALKSSFKRQPETTLSLPIVWRDETDQLLYEQARVSRVFNSRTPKRYPRAIVSARKESDMLKAVKLATGEKCSISVRAGAHSWPVWSIRNDAVVVDLGNYRELKLDEETGVVCASPSTGGKDLVDYLLRSERVFPAGHCPDVGIGGFLLCGGMGWNCNVCPFP
jgi:FAD/FMN-containing dehydrogenase